MATADTKTQLLDAAELLARRNGVDGFSYGDLSAQIGVRKASIHYHFPSKADLLHEIMDRYGERVVMALNAFSDDISGADQQLLAFVDFYRSALLEGSALCLCVALTVNKDGLSEDTRFSITSYRERAIAWLEKTLNKGIAEGSVADVQDTKAEASSLLALVEGAQISARLSESLETYDKATGLLKRRLLKSNP